MSSKKKLGEINEIIKDDDIYPRVQINHKAIESYVEAMKIGAQFPDILIQKINNSETELVILLDGYHRNEAYKKYLNFVSKNKPDIDEEDDSGIIWNNEIGYIFWKDETLEKKEYLNELRIESIRRNLEHGIILEDKDKKAMCRIMAKEDIEIEIKYHHFKDIFGVSIGTIKEWISDIRTRQKGTRNNLIYRLSTLGWTQEEIADKVGLSQPRILQIINNFNSEKIYNDWKSGKKPPELAEYYGFDIPMVWNILLQESDDIERFKKFGKKDYGNDQPKMSDYWKFNKGIEYIGKDYPGMLWGQDIMNILYRFSKQGDLIVDPMAGGGSVIDTCLIMGRKCLGFDINSIRDDIKEWDIRNGFPENIKEAVLIILDPPYYKKKEDAYNCEEITKDRKTFLGYINKLSKDCGVILKSDGYIALVFSQYIDYEEEEDSILGIDYGRIFEDNGFRLILEIQSPLTFNNQYEPHAIENAKKYVPWRILPVSRSWYIFKKIGSVENIGS